MILDGVIKHCPDENDTSNQSIIYKAKESKEIQEDLAMLGELNGTATERDCSTCTHGDEIDGSNCYKCVKGMCSNYEPTTENISEVECVSKKAVDELIWRYLRRNTADNIIAFYEHFLDLSPVTPQDLALDKIRAEILDKMQYHSGSGDEVVQAYADGLHDSIRIIDKCRAELVSK